MIQPNARLHGVPGLLAALSLTPLTLVGGGLLLPLVPLEMQRRGVTLVAAGLTTAMFMGATVVVQLASAKLLRTFGYRPVIATGSLLIGLPCLAMLLVGPSWWYAVAVLRGMGFGLLTVSCTSLPTRIAPRRLLGRAAAAQGAIAGLTQAFGIGSGLVVDHFFNFTTAVVAATMMPLIACAVRPSVPATTEAPAETVVDESKPLRIELRATGITTVIVTFSAVYGALSLLIPSRGVGPLLGAMVLFTISLATTVGRYLAGNRTDRGNHAAFAPAAMVIGAAGIICLRLPLEGAWRMLPLCLSAAVVGVCYGIVQNDTLISLYHLFGHRGRATGSKWWNVGIDFGLGAGSYGVGAIAATYGVSIAYFAMAVMILLCAPLTRLMVIDRYVQDRGTATDPARDRKRQPEEAARSCRADPTGRRQGKTT
jgi:MFS family permease